MRRGWKAILVIAAVCTMTATQSPAAERYVEELTWGMGAVGANLLYFPVKLLYATGGGLVGGLAFGLTGGNLEAAQNVWSPSLGGTWVLSPEMLRGKQPILFSGESYERPSDRLVIEPLVEPK